MTSRMMNYRYASLIVGAASSSCLLLLNNPRTSCCDPSSKFPVVMSTWDFGKKANGVAWIILKSGGRALDAVELGVRSTESDPSERSVGYGGRPDREGKVTLDACIMDDKFNIGSVACLENIIHAVSVARAVMENSPHVMLVGDGALQFALKNGFKKESLLIEESEREWKEWLVTSKYRPIVNIENHDTIGMIAIDVHGNLSGACTTSGNDSVSFLFFILFFFISNS